jgi:hypothetical protein
VTAAQIGYVQYFGMDIDLLYIEMAMLNLRLYGITPMTLEPVTLEALAPLKETAGPRAEAYQEVVTAPPAEQPAATAAVVELINTHRRQQLSLFDEE